MGVELVPDAGRAEQEAVSLAITAALAATRISSPWWRAGLDDALGQTPSGPRPSDYEAVRSPRRTRGATRA